MGRGPTPVTKKKTASGQFDGLRYAMSCMQGWRPTMEDTHRVSLKLPGHLNDWAYAGLFDGHGGKKVATYASKNLLQKILKNINQISSKSSSSNNDDADDDDDAAPTSTDEQQTQIKNAIVKGFLNLDDTMRKSKLIDDDSGSTAVCIMLSPTHLYVAHVGDSRALLSRGRVHYVTTDHKPSTKLEKSRIEAAGGSVHKNSCCDRVQGRLAMSRALGDFTYKNNPSKAQCDQMVIPMPEVKIIERSQLQDEFLVLACDGVFDVMSNTELTTFIRNEMSKTKDLKTICNRVIDHCLKIGSTDNMSIIIITLPGCPSKDDLKRDRKLKLAQMNKNIRAKAKKGIKSDGNNNDLVSRPSTRSGAGDAAHEDNREANNDNEMDTSNVGGSQIPKTKEGLKNPFIIYFLDYLKSNGGNICEAAKHCGESWANLAAPEKRKYRRRYQYAKNKRANKQSTTKQSLRKTRKT